MGGGRGHGQAGVEFGDEGVSFGRGRLRLLLGRRHLAIGDGVMNLNPPVELLLFRTK